MTLLHCCGLALLLTLPLACADDEKPADPGSDAGTCDGGACQVSLDEFQSASLNCPATYESAQDEYVNTPDECVYAIYECEGLQGAAYQYGFTGDNVQCYYDTDGALVGAIRTSDHGYNTVAGELPAVSCYAGPICD